MMLMRLVHVISELPLETQPLVFYVGLNFMVLMVEIVYGFLAGSLGLVCDGVHMLINCFGIALSLVALELSKTPPLLGSSYGFQRLHVLAAFTNAVFLLFVSVFVVVEALSRFGETHDGHSDHVVSVAAVGLMINIIGLGLVGLSSRRSLQVSAASSPKKVSKRFTSTGSGISVGSGDYTMMQRSLSQSSTNSSSSLLIDIGRSSVHSRYARMLNLQSVLLHACCDVVNSVGVIISSLLVQRKGWSFADPLMALMIAGLILRASLPLLFTSGQTLLQVAPITNRTALEKAIREISMLNGVLECHNEHLWTYAPEIQVLTINIRVRDDVNEADILPNIQNILGHLALHLTIQLNKDHV